MRDPRSRRAVSGARIDWQRPPAWAGPPLSNSGVNRFLAPAESHRQPSRSLPGDLMDKDAFRSALKALHLTCEDFAELTGWSVRTAYEWGERLSVRRRPAPAGDPGADAGSAAGGAVSDWVSE
jgi:hypothetical protein